MKELAATLRRKFKVSPADVPLLEEYRMRAAVVIPIPLPAAVCRDPDDDLVLATAVAARASVVVTGDDDLLVLKSHKGIAIMSPRQFLEHLDRL